MFGYMEAPYKVEEHLDIQTPTGETQRIELRLADNQRRVGGLPYIVVEGMDTAGRPVLDRLYLYESRECLERDWVKLTEDVSVTEKELDYVEVIVDHMTGYRKDGGIAMY